LGSEWAWGENSSRLWRTHWHLVHIGRTFRNRGLQTIGAAAREREERSEVIKQDERGTPLKFRRALIYSAGVMTLQKPEPKPATTTAQAVVLLETVLGPVQAALLALAIRRKFMR